MDALVGAEAGCISIALAEVRSVTALLWALAGLILGVLACSAWLRAVVSDSVYGF